jgi:hypothetical protein
MIGRSQMTMPPEWMPRCRGNVWTWLAYSTISAGMPSSISACATLPHRSICLLHASCWPGEWPKARAMSRTADRGR